MGSDQGESTVSPVIEGATEAPQVAAESASSVPDAVPVNSAETGVPGELSKSQDSSESLGPSSSVEPSDSAAGSVEPPQPTVNKPIKRKRLAQDIAGKLQDNVEINPYDIDSWLELIKVIKKKDKLQELRETYEQLLKVLPQSAEIWIDYIDIELANGEFPRVEQLFGRCLTRVPSVQLWSNYLGYIRRISNIETQGDAARTTISQAYEFVLDHIGIDYKSTHIWQDYIDFIKSKPTSSTWEQQQKMDLIRKAYRRAICIPLINIENLWQGYNSFETNLNRSTARKFINEKSAAYMQARSSLQEIKKLAKNLDTSTLPRQLKYTVKELEALKGWKRWIAWEKKNPMELEDEKEVIKRVSHLYKQSLMTLRFHESMWFEAAEFFTESDSESVAIELLVDGIVALPTSSLLAYKLAEIYECQGRRDDLIGAYKGLISALQTKRTKILEAGEEEGGNVVDEASAKSVELHISMAYIAYMTSMKRAYGIKEARKVFGEGRKLAFSTHHLYCASAMMEYHNNKDSGIAEKIFEMGLKRFQENADFVKTYLEFLILVNDDTNARALFEKSITKLDGAAARPLYDIFLKYEADYGELSALIKLEKRYRELYSVDEGTLFTQRYISFGVDVISPSLIERRPRDSLANVTASKKGAVAVDKHVDPEPSAKRVATSLEPANEHKSTTIPVGIINLLRVLPPASTYKAAIFDSVKMVEMLKGLKVPKE